MVMEAKEREKPAINGRVSARLPRDLRDGFFLPNSGGSITAMSSVIEYISLTLTFFESPFLLVVSSYPAIFDHPDSSLGLARRALYPTLPPRPLPAPLTRPKPSPLSYHSVETCRGDERKRHSRRRMSRARATLSRQPHRRPSSSSLADPADCARANSNPSRLLRGQNQWLMQPSVQQPPPLSPPPPRPPDSLLHSITLRRENRKTRIFAIVLGDDRSFYFYNFFFSFLGEVASIGFDDSPEARTCRITSRD